MSVEADPTIAALRAIMVRVNAACEAAVAKSALAVQQAGMGKTKVRSGTLRRSWRMELLPSEGGVYAARVGPTTVYARRIELGFQGPDSLGRVYNQQPSPYVKPARDETLPAIMGFVEAELRKALRA